MNRTHLLLIALTVSIALLVPSGAWPYDPMGVDEPEGMDDVDLAPADGPNGRYAVLNDDDEIEVLIGDVNPYVDTGGVSQGSVSTIPRIFTVTNTGSTAVSVWITDGVNALEYIRSSNEYESIEGQTDGVALGPNETASVGLRIDASDEADVERADSFTVHASRIETDRPTTDRSETSGSDRAGETGSEPSPVTATDETVSEPTNPLDGTEAPPTSANCDGQTAVSTDGETDTPTPTPARIDGNLSMPTVSSPPPESHQSPSGERNRTTATGRSTLSTTVTPSLLAVLAIAAVLLALLRQVGKES